MESIDRRDIAARSAEEAMVHKAFGIYVHITWHTRLRARGIGRAEVEILAEVVRQAAEQRSVHVHEIAVLSDHVHIIAGVRPDIAIAPFIRHTKSESARRINLMRGQVFQWARGYFVESLSRNHLSAACTYVAGQHRRHPDRVPI